MRALDLGCGNGLFCCMLASGGVGEVMGVDYADSAVELAKGVRRRGWRRVGWGGVFWS
jgi:2-polyprenyl-3-methyl-5-hydroxy-6-metoxy-1,4-benzoquinol methylase